MNQTRDLSMYDEPPPYTAAVSESEPSSSIYSGDSLTYLEHERSSELPPAFSRFPITLVIHPKSTLIGPRIGGRALYELSCPLDGHACNVFLAEVPPDMQLHEDGHLLEVEKQHHLYKIQEAPELPRDPSHTAISGQSKNLFQGTILRRGWKGCTWDATSHGERWMAKGDLIYSAKQQGSCLEWSGQDEKFVAIERRAVNRATEDETLDILVPLVKKMLDMMVAVWVARIYQDTQKDGVKEEEAERKRKREEQRAKDLEVGKPQSIIRDMKSKLGVGYGGKTGSR